jgi:hypothetical protein
MTKAKKPKAPTHRERELSIGDAVSEAFGELQTLGEEMREAFDNTPESLQQSGVGERRGEAADALENLTEPSVPKSLEPLVVKWQVRILSPSAERRKTRSDRRYEAVETLNVVKDFLDEIKDADKNLFSDDEKEEAETLRDEIENLVDEAESVEFPGMRG